MCDEFEKGPKADKANLKDINAFVAWHKRITGRDVAYTIRAGRIVYDQTVDERDEEPVDCTCDSDDDGSGIEDEDDGSQCRACMVRRTNARRLDYFDTAMHDVAGIVRSTVFGPEHPWSAVTTACTLKWEDDVLVITNRVSRKCVEMGLGTLHIGEAPSTCNRFTFGIGRFGETCYIEGDLDNGTGLDGLLKRMLHADPALLVPFARMYAAHLLHNEAMPVTLVPGSNCVQIGGIQCTPTQLYLPCCHALGMVAIDAATHDALQRAFREEYADRLKCVISYATTLIGQQEERRRAGKEISPERAASVERATAKRAAAWAAQGAMEAHVKRFKAN